METLEAIRTRRSVRCFDARIKEAGRGLLEKVLDAGRMAPSAGNLQSQEFIIVRDDAVKKEVGRACFGQDFVSKAPVIVVVCGNKRKSEGGYGTRGRDFYALADACASAQNMLLAAHDLGLASCWVGAFDDAALCKALSIPKNDVVPIAVLPMGFPAEHPEMPRRKPLKSFVHEEKY